MLKNPITKKLFIVLTILIVILAGLEVRSMFRITEKKKVEKPVYKKIGPYTISLEQTSLQKELAKQLQEAVDSKNDEKIVKSVAQYFVSDYFSIRNKKVSDNIGGLNLVFSKNKKQFKTNALDSYYQDIPELVTEYKNANLPLVTKVNAKNISKVALDSVVLDKKIVDSIKAIKDVNVSWEYESNEVVDTQALNLVNTSIIRLVQDKDKNWWVFELRSVEDEQY